MHMYFDIDETDGTLTLSDPITNRLLRRHCRTLCKCGGSDEYIAVIRKIVRTRDPQAIEVLAGLLDSPGPVGREAAKGLVRFGLVAVPAIERVLRESTDGNALEHAEWARSRLTALGRA